MFIKISSTFNATTERVCQELSKTKLLHYVGKPLIQFIPVNGDLPEVWQEGEYTVEMKLFSIIPFGKQKVVIKQPSEEEKKKHHYAMLDDGRGELISTWRHLITVDEVNNGKALYTDTVEVQAGVLTFFVWVFANIFFWHRQRRWKKLIQNNFSYQ
ncbi:MAG TPA: hypothetical protein DIW23_13385 [Anaerolineae bacterium]|nr:hypothetical protein [Anaerolineae bacterium]